ncbi:hypothetical protein GS896_27555 [Rhodococcus hoagii]|nr:hypothetical protein [Prescottella equi]MBM4719728.1 hypothetical protein [Prescottella equi]NKR23525.1 hypothetical protein [Prescottella equi]NKT56321.1 hypothetical protein [Prescottella equi]NKZ80615.1 hypothetical protein [Prescottella equi]
MHYDQAAIMAAGEDLGQGWSKTVVKLDEGDTAYSGVSTKYDFRGPGEVAYMMHASGWNVDPSDTITRAPR